jgi:hypothetical protein
VITSSISRNFEITMSGICFAKPAEVEFEMLSDRRAGTEQLQG